MTAPELPPLPHMPRDKAAIVEARERILLARIAELEADAAWRSYVDEFVGSDALRELRRRFDAANRNLETGVPGG